jgi:hypothetical protein
LTEADWNSSTELQAMLDWLRRQGKLSERKARLFAAATCRGFCPVVSDERFCQAVETIERYADRLTSKAALKRARQAVRAARHSVSLRSRGGRTTWAACWLAETGATENAYMMVADQVQRLADLGTLGLTTKALWPDSALLRDIFGNPFRAPPSIPASVSTWQDATAVRLAEATYDCRRLPSGTLEPERLAVLADALEEAGCQEASVLTHLREKGSHWRGCWVLDALLGRS